MQEVRWKGKGAKTIGNGFEFLWSGGGKSENGVGLIVVNSLIGKVVGVERYNVRVMKVDIVIGDVIWEVLSCYCPQAGRSVNENEEFYELMDKAVTSERMLVGGDFNGHVGCNMRGFGEVQGGFGIGQINDAETRLLDWIVGKGLRLMNTCFQKKKSRLIKFRLGETETTIDYIHVNNKYGSSVKDVKIFSGEEIVSQHCLLSMGMVFKREVQEESKNFRKKIETVKVQRVGGEKKVYCKM